MMYGPRPVVALNTIYKFSLAFSSIPTLVVGFFSCMNIKRIFTLLMGIATIHIYTIYLEHILLSRLDVAILC